MIIYWWHLCFLSAMATCRLYDFIQLLLRTLKEFLTLLGICQCSFYFSMVTLTIKSCCMDKASRRKPTKWPERAKDACGFDPNSVLVCTHPFPSTVQLMRIQKHIHNSEWCCESGLAVLSPKRVWQCILGTCLSYRERTIHHECPSGLSLDFVLLLLLFFHVSLLWCLFLTFYNQIFLQLALKIRWIFLLGLPHTNESSSFQCALLY